MPFGARSKQSTRNAEKKKRRDAEERRDAEDFIKGDRHSERLLICYSLRISPVPRQKRFFREFREMLRQWGDSEACYGDEVRCGF